MQIRNHLIFAAIIFVAVFVFLIPSFSLSKKTISFSTNQEDVNSIKSTLESDVSLKQQNLSIKMTEDSSKELVIIPENEVAIIPIEKSELSVSGNFRLYLGNKKVSQPDSLRTSGFEYSFEATDGQLVRIISDKEIKSISNNLIEVSSGARIKYDQLFKNIPNQLINSPHTLTNLKRLGIEQRFTSLDLQGFTLNQNVLDKFGLKPLPKVTKLRGFLNPKNGHVLAGDAVTVVSKINEAIATKVPGFEIFKRNSAKLYPIIDVSEKERGLNSSVPCNGYFLDIELEKADTVQMAIFSSKIGEDSWTYPNGTKTQYIAFSSPHSAYAPDESATVQYSPLGLDKNALKLIKAENREGLGKGVMVAILDTGFFSGDTQKVKIYDDFKGYARNLTAHFLETVTFIQNDKQNDLDNLKKFPTLNESQDEYENLENKKIGHGTMVAALVSEVAPAAKILPLKVCTSDGVCQEIDIIRGICYALQNAKETQQKLILNLSLGSREQSPFLRDFLEYAIQEGAGVIVSAGSQSDKDDKDPRYPAALSSTTRASKGLEGMLVVTAVTNEGKPFEKAIRGTYVDIAAPGVLLEGIKPNGGAYYGFTGTSFAAPFAAGVLAVCMANNPTISVSNLIAKIKAEKISFTEGDFTESGVGVLNAEVCLTK